MMQFLFSCREGEHNDIVKREFPWLNSIDHHP